MGIFPGTQYYLEEAIDHGKENGAKALIVLIDTPGGMLQTTQKMVQDILNAPFPIFVYIYPSGASAISAGVFITLSAHIAAMAPGTSIGAAHPVTGGGGDIKGDMRKKVEEITTAMMRSIADERGRNVEWAEKAVKESASLTEKEALEEGVIDVIASNIDELLSKVKGKKIKVQGKEVILKDLSSLPRKEIKPSFRTKVLNTFANPTMLGILFLIATTGIVAELYHPGAILPGVIGIIALLLFLVSVQVVPVNSGALLLLLVGAALIIAELFVPSGILGVGGVISIILGTIYLVNKKIEPGMSIDWGLFLPILVLVVGVLLLVLYMFIRSRSVRKLTGKEGLVGRKGEVLDEVSEKEGKILVEGEIWKAVAKDGPIKRGESVEVVAIKEGMVLEVKRSES
ncbi:MAG: nodulation protein NfeD [Candidatus Dadabacteria bacterium]|nr:MAG: nodulation protein NfeD [Candidatus Dadabacteria bacterium]